jgi:hypothetical protein
MNVKNKKETRNVIYKLNHFFKSYITTEDPQTQFDELLEKIGFRCFWFVVGVIAAQLLIYIRLGVW